MDLSALKERFSGGRLFHATIVTGGSEESRLAAGKFIAKAAVCDHEDAVPCGHCRDCRKAERGVHPDITLVEREEDKKELTVDIIRAVRAGAVVIPNEANRSVFIIREADTMNLQAQNALLKTLEEPPSHAVLVLLAENPERLLPTVRSRCETLTLPPEDRKVDGDGEKLARAVLSAYEAGDRLALVKALLPLEKAGRTELPEILSALRLMAVRETAREKRLTPERLYRLTEALQKAEKLLGVNVASGHIAGLLMGELID